MATVIKLRPLPESSLNRAECQEWHRKIAGVEQYLKKENCYYTYYPNGNQGWENQQRYIKEIIKEYADAQGYKFEWEGGTPSMCSVATLHYVPASD